MNNKIENKNFIIKRNDYNYEIKNLHKIYDIKNIEELIKDLNERKNFFCLIKKLILSTNFYSKYKMKSAFNLLFSLHIIIISTGFFSIIHDKKLIDNKKKLFYFIFKLIFSNLSIIPCWYILYDTAFKNNKMTENKMFNLSKYLVNNFNNNNINNKFFYNINEDFSLKITKKNYNKNNYNFKENNNNNNIYNLNIINYFITINLEQFSIENNIFSQKFIPKEDLNIVLDYKYFIKKELQNRAKIFLNNYFLPVIFSLFNLIFLNQKSNNFKDIIILLVMIVSFSLILKIEYNYKKEFKIKLKNIIKKHNLDLIQNGKFLFLSNNLIFLININELGKKYDILSLEKYINKLININI